MHVRLAHFAHFTLSAVLVLGLAACSTEPKPARYRPPSEHGLTWRLLHPFAPREKTPPPPPPSPTVEAFQPPLKRGLGWRVLHPFSREGKPATARKAGVQVTVEADNASPSLQATRQIGVRVLVTNYTSTLISLTFPTSQRIEIVGRGADGKLFYTYSTDRSFTQEVTVLTINPGERLEYSENVPTRFMTAGRSYYITASIVGQVGMEGSASITAMP